MLRTEMVVILEDKYILKERAHCMEKKLEMGVTSV